MINPERKQTEVVICRHGAVDNPSNIIYGSSIDVHLSEPGREQMRAAAHHLQALHIIPDVIYSSPLSRAIESVDEVERVYGNTIPHFVKKDLEDDRSPGLANKPFDLIDEVHALGYDTYDTDVPLLKGLEIEKKSDLVARMERVMAEIIQTHKNETIFVVVHGDPSALWYWTQLHPGQALPKIQDLENRGMYLEKGKMWILNYDEDDKIVSILY